jgi:uncharacterized protein YkwD
VQALNAVARRFAALGEPLPHNIVLAGVQSFGLQSIRATPRGQSGRNPIPRLSSESGARPIERAGEAAYAFGMKWWAMIWLSAALTWSQNGDSAARNLFVNFTPDSFQKHPPARHELEVSKLNTNLLAAAVFHETNARRIARNLPPLRFEARARQAAAIQARIMSARGSISHDNPERKDLQTLEDRLEAASLKPRFAAENVATAFAWQYESGKPFYQRHDERGNLIVSNTPDGGPIPPHTYLSFAKALVDSWMNSPGHRKNILHEKPKFLGTSCAPGANDETPIPKLYCAQVFFTPLD